jgi:outer membrane protein assembly factor BamE (lipoprotein component of BamABCDE complex)
VLIDLQDCYRILELEPTATLEDVKISYRELVKVWHPDRFAHDPKLQHKAQEKLKQINLAYENVCKVLLADPSPNKTSGTRSARHQQDPKSGNSSASKPKSPSEPTSGPPRQPSQTPKPKTALRTSIFALAAIILAVVTVLILENDSVNHGRGESSRPLSTPVAPNSLTVPKSLIQSDIPVPNHSEQIQTEPQSLLTNPAPAAVSNTAVTTNRVEPPLEAAMAREPEAPTKRKADATFFTTGSTKEEVLAIQGTPTRIKDNEFGYDFSRVEFQGDRVISWNDISKVLKVRMLPTTQASTLKYFTVGSTKDEVLAVQGTPTQIKANEFGYDFSRVEFQDDRVISWNDISKILKAKLLPATQAAQGYFTVGSTKDEVLSIQGTPTRIRGNEFGYSFSRVEFQDDRVISWNDISKILKAKLLPTTQVDAQAFFTVGSTKDEVLAVQGTPTRIRGNEFGYDFSRVEFQDGHVVSWNDISKVLKTKPAPKSAN